MSGRASRAGGARDRVRIGTRRRSSGFRPPTTRPRRAWSTACSGHRLRHPRYPRELRPSGRDRHAAAAAVAVDPRLLRGHGPDDSDAPAGAAGGDGGRRHVACVALASYVTAPLWWPTVGSRHKPPCRRASPCPDSLNGRPRTRLSAPTGGHEGHELAQGTEPALDVMHLPAEPRLRGGVDRPAVRETSDDGVPRSAAIHASRAV